MEPNVAMVVPEGSPNYGPLVGMFTTSAHSGLILQQMVSVGVRIQ